MEIDTKKMFPSHWNVIQSSNHDINYMHLLVNIVLFKRIEKVLKFDLLANYNF
jgi:hypothetical protein